jgi:hypothetical protein
MPSAYSFRSHIVVPISKKQLFDTPNYDNQKGCPQHNSLIGFGDIYQEKKQ